MSGLFCELYFGSIGGRPICRGRLTVAIANEGPLAVLGHDHICLAVSSQRLCQGPTEEPQPADSPMGFRGLAQDYIA